MTRVRVGIVSWNTAALLDRCLDALPAALGDLDASVVVVDNASSDGSAEVAARHPNVRVIRNPRNLGYARAMNQALGDADAEALVALNPDTEAPPGSLALLVGRLLVEPDVGLVAPRLLNEDGTTQHSAYRFLSLRLAAIVCLLPRSLLRGGLGARWWLEGHSDHRRKCDVEWCVGAVHVLRAEALHGQPPYDERWFMYVEDLDLCWRLARGGWRRRLEGDIAVPHAGNAAGTLAWGEARDERHLAAALDWYARERGKARMRTWALVNALGLALRLARFAPRVALNRARRRRGRTGAGALAHGLRLHLRAALSGIPPEPPAGVEAGDAPSSREPR